MVAVENKAINDESNAMLRETSLLGVTLREPEVLVSLGAPATAYIQAHHQLVSRDSLFAMVSASGVANLVAMA